MYTIYNIYICLLIKVSTFSRNSMKMNMSIFHSRFSITHITYASREPLIKRLSREVISWRAAYSSRIV